MTRLSELICNLEQQFLDPYQLALKADAKTEAFRDSLAFINGTFGAAFTLEGLDGSSATSLPEEYLPALIRGASGSVLQMVLQHKFASYSNLPLQSDQLADWARYLFTERDTLLDRLRLASLHNASNLAWAKWELEENKSYD